MQCQAIVNGHRCRNEAIGLLYCAYHDRELDEVRNNWYSRHPLDDSEVDEVPEVVGDLTKDLEFQQGVDLDKEIAEAMADDPYPYNRLVKRRDYGNYDGSYRYNQPVVVPPPPVKLEEKQFREVDQVEHMHYIVARHNDEYYAVFLSVYPGAPSVAELMKTILEEEELYAINDLKTAKAFIVGSYDTFRGAEAKFLGVEGISRVRTRLSRAKDPGFIPPNLRALEDAKLDKWIPEKWKARLQEWVKKGKQGWYTSVRFTKSSLL